MKNVRYRLCDDSFSARMIRQRNDANMLDEGLMLDIADTFLTTQFEGGRHETRVELIEVTEG